MYKKDQLNIWPQLSNQNQSVLASLSKRTVDQVLDNIPDNPLLSRKALIPNSLNKTKTKQKSSNSGKPKMKAIDIFVFFYTSCLS